MVFDEVLKREIPSHWAHKKVKEYMSIGSGYSFKPDNYSKDGAHKVITIKAVQNDELNTSTADKIDRIPGNIPDFCKLRAGDILMSLTGNVGRIAVVAEENLLLNQRVGKFIFDDKNMSMYLYALFTSDEQKMRFDNLANGSSQANLSPIQAVDFNFVLPDDKILAQFQSIINPIFAQIVTNKQESSRLANLRDFLLPLLMNGQVSVVD